jgi:hypothetical protein
MFWRQDAKPPVERPPEVEPLMPAESGPMDHSGGSMPTDDQPQGDAPSSASPPEDVAEVPVAADPDSDAPPPPAGAPKPTVPLLAEMKLDLSATHVEATLPDEFHLAWGLDFSPGAEWLVSRGTWTVVWNVSELRQEAVPMVRGKLSFGVPTIVPADSPDSPLHALPGADGWMVRPVDGAFVALVQTGLVHFPVLSQPGTINEADAMRLRYLLLAPDASVVAALRQRHGGAESGTELVLLDPLDGGLIKTLETFGQVSGGTRDWYHAAAFSADSRLLAACVPGEQGELEVRAWDVETFTEWPTTPVTASHSVWLAEGGRLLVAVDGNRDGPVQTVRVFELATGTLVAERLNPEEGHSGTIQAAAFSMADSLFAVGDSTGEVVLYDLKSPEAIARVSAHEAGVTAVAFSYDGRLLATAGHDRTIRLWARADTPAVLK